MENEKTKRQLTRTFGITYYGEDAKEPKALSTEYLENNIAISIHRPISGGDTKFDYKTGNVIYLPGKSAKVLARYMKKAIEARDNQKNFTPVAIASANNLIEVSLGSHKKTATDICITIYNDINADSKKCQSQATFGFRNVNVIRNYDPENGTYENEYVDADIDFFIQQLIEFSKADTGAYAHANRKHFKFDMDRIISRQIEICNALGIQPQNYSSTNNKMWSSSNGSDSVSLISNSDSILDELDG